jgi:hypothetical protein
VASPEVHVWTSSPLPSRLPESCQVVALQGERDQPPRVCMLLWRDAAGGTARPVVLREQHDCRVMLGAMVDARDRVLLWLEIWVQETGALKDIELGFQEGLTNRLLDERWLQRASAMETTGVQPPAWLGWEEEHPRPLFLIWDANGQAKLVHPTTDSGNTWVLCTDTDRLRAHDLKPYAEDNQRYLHVKERPDLGLVPCDAIAAGSVVDPKIAVKLSLPAGAVPVNAGGGLLLARPYSSYAYEEYVDVLSGIASAGPGSVVSTQISHTMRGLASASRGEGGQLLLGPAGRAGRLLEIYHLKLRLLMDALLAVRSAVDLSQCPMLNLEQASFRVLAQPAPGRLPYLWTARAVLADGGEGVRLPIRNTETPYYVPLRKRDASVWRPDASGRFMEGRTQFNVETVIDGPAGLVVEGLLTQPDEMDIRRNDLIRLRFTAAGTRCELYAIVSADSRLGASETLLRTIPQKMPEPVTRGLEGVRFAVNYRVIPFMSTPFDLHALAVLAVRTLLVNERGLLSKVKNRVEMLAREAARLSDAARPLPLEERIGIVLQKNAELKTWLGAHRVAAAGEGGPVAHDAMGVVTSELWHATLAMIVRAFPELSEESTCKDLGHTDADALHRVFDPMMTELDRLLVKSRALLLGEQSMNREIADVIRAMMKDV